MISFMKVPSAISYVAVSLQALLAALTVAMRLKMTVLEGLVLLRGGKKSCPMRGYLLHQ